MFDLSINRDISVWLSLAFIVGGLVALSWSADRFVEAAARLARAFGVSPLIVGMVIIGFGTSAPELAVSVLSALSDQSNLFSVYSIWRRSSISETMTECSAMVVP